MSDQIRKHVVDDLVRKVRALGHAVRLDETADTDDVKRKQKAFKDARAKATKAEQQAAWKIVGDN